MESAKEKDGKKQQESAAKAAQDKGETNTPTQDSMAATRAHMTLLCNRCHCVCVLASNYTRATTHAHAHAHSHSCSYSISLRAHAPKC